MESSDLTAKDEKRKRVYLWLTDSWEKLWCIPAWDPRCFATSTFHHKGHRNSIIHWNREEGPKGGGRHRDYSLYSKSTTATPPTHTHQGHILFKITFCREAQGHSTLGLWPKEADTIGSETRGPLSRPSSCLPLKETFLFGKELLIAVMCDGIAYIKIILLGKKLQVLYIC